MLQFAQELIPDIDRPGNCKTVDTGPRDKEGQRDTHRERERDRQRHRERVQDKASNV